MGESRLKVVLKKVSLQNSRSLKKTGPNTYTYYWYGGIDSDARNQIEERLFNITKENQNYFFRATNNPKEPNIVNKVLSVDHSTGQKEKGLSVSESPGYSLQGFKYIYVVTGRILGYGSDGEPLLELGTIRVISTTMRGDINSTWKRKYYNLAKKNLKKHGIDPEDYIDLFIQKKYTLLR